jgi:CHAT domain-containing protein/Tfp pilus assembly protein PilF
MKLWRESLRRASVVRDSAGIAAALGNIGAGFYGLGQRDSATVYFTRARGLATSIGDYRTRGNAIGNLANISKDKGDFTRATALYTEASAIRERSGDSRGDAADRNNLGLIARELGDLKGARRYFEQALEINQRDGRLQQVALNLTNLADIASITGEFAGARDLYEKALAINRDASDVAETAFVLHDIGQLYIRRGDYRLARARISEALRIYDETGAQLEAVAARQDLAAIDAAMGDLQAALATLRRAEHDASAAEADPGLQAGLVLARADLSVQLGAFADAEKEYQRAEQLFAQSRDEQGRADAQHGRGLLLYLGKDYAGALRVLDLAARAQTLAEDRRALALTELLVGYVQREQGDTAAARRTLTRVHTLLRELGDAVGEAAAFHALGELAAMRGATLAAESLYRSGLERLGARPAADVRWRLHASLGQALRSRRALGPAAQELNAAISTLERTAAALRLEDRRAGFLADKWQTYAELARVEQTRGRVAEAFAVSERMRARQMLDMLARGKVAAPSTATERAQDLRRTIAELTTAIEAAGPDGQSLREPVLAAQSVDAAREALDQSQRAYARILVEMRESDPAFARLVSTETLSWRPVAARLRRDEVFLEYLVMDSTSTVFVVTRDTVVAIDLDVSRQTLADRIEFSRRTMDRPRSPASTLWPSSLRQLHHYLIEPVERAGYLKNKRTLIIAPHAELHFLSFAALLVPGTPDRFLVERFEIAYAPSATAWVRLGERAAAQRARGVLALAPRVERLPASRAEVGAIRRIYGRRATVRIGDDASERTLRAALPRTGILHLATFGVLNKHNPLFSFVELAPEPGDDGRLEVHEVFGLDLSGQLVVLSACQTALGSGAAADVPAGDDWVGLVQAFLHAGAGSVLASLWPVDDRATAQLMERFHSGLASGQSEAAALAAAQRAALRQSRTAHPFYWAGFALSGTRQRN